VGGSVAALACLALALAAPAAGAEGLRWAGTFGRTSAIATVPKNLNQVLADQIEAQPGTVVDWEDLSDVGGWSIRFAALAPLNRRMDVGVELFYDDLASIVAALKTDTGELLDAAAFLHRATWGAAYRLDAKLWSLPGHTSWLPPSTLVATGTSGMWRVADDVVRQRFAEEDAFGWSLGLGWRFQLPGRIAAGPAFRYCRVFNDRLGRYVTASLDWGWR